MFVYENLVQIWRQVPGWVFDDQVRVPAACIWLVFETTRSAREKMGRLLRSTRTVPEVEIVSTITNYSLWYCGCVSAEPHP